MKIGMSLGMRGQRGLSQIQRAIAFLRTLGTSAHAWIPGAGGVSVASLPSNNYLLSDGSTGYSTVDGVDGLTLDGMGVTTNLTVSQDLSTWTSSGAFLNWNGSTATATTITTTGIEGSRYVRYACTPGTRVTFAATVVAGTTTGFVAVVFGTSGLGYISDSASSRVVSGAVYVSAIAPANAAYVELVVRGTGSGLTVGFTNLASTINTGTHLTQATTANKPLVRRGMYNHARYSQDLTNAQWAKTGTASAPTATTCNVPTVNDYIYMSLTPGATFAGSVVTVAHELSGSGGIDIGFYDNIKGFDNRFVVALTATPTVYTFTATVGAGATDVRCFLGRISGGATATSFTCAKSGVFLGTWTAAQILAEGGIPTTTTTAASNTAAGKYWWSFDGNDSLAAGSVPFQFSDDFCLHFSAQLSAASGNQTIYAATNVAGDRAPWVRFESTGKVVFQCFQTTGTLTAEAQSTATYVGQAIIIRCRKVGSTITLWINGVQVASASTAALTSMGTITTALFGQFGWSALYYTGALGWSVSVTGTQTDADGLTIDRLLASTFPGAPVF